MRLKSFESLCRPRRSHIPAGRFSALCLLCFACCTYARGAAADDASNETVIEMKTVAGLRYDPPRFAVAPGTKVRVQIENDDDMPHNFVLTQPGARMEIVEAAGAMPFNPAS